MDYCLYLDRSNLKGQHPMQRGWVVSVAYRDMIAGISEAREAAGVSQRELARRLGKPPSFVNKIEQLERRLDLLEFICIAEALGLTASMLLERVRSRLPVAIAL